MILAPSKIVILGSGALQIGQAGEFDYAGTQALKALREEGHQLVLLNPNIASLQSSEDLVDSLYLLPLTLEFAANIIEKEKPTAILLGFGGQTALNLGLELAEAGYLENIKVLGTPLKAIHQSEDRERFQQLLRKLNLPIVKSWNIKNTEQANLALKSIGFPLMLRAAYALGGLGSAHVKDSVELMQTLEKSLASGTQLLLEESLLGWKEIEYEMLRDVYGNCIAVCNMENLDPVGVHTGDSIVVAPSQTLDNDSYQRLRSVAIAIMNELGIIGACNLQFALSPDHKEYRIIELNARVSRSSALASKATAYPIAWVATKLALGYGLHEVANKVTNQSTAFFEPSLDYVVLKLPKWDFEKFNISNPILGTAMQSVGEVMAIAAGFEEALQKGIRMLDLGDEGLFGSMKIEEEKLEDLLLLPTPNRIKAIVNAFEYGWSLDRIAQLTQINNWFLVRIQSAWACWKNYVANPHCLQVLKAAKAAGCSDRQLGQIAWPELSPDAAAAKLRQRRLDAGIKPALRKIDGFAGALPAQTDYYYFSYAGQQSEWPEKSDWVLVLGAGPYAVGSSVEFDYAAVRSIEALQAFGLKAAMLNCNPETVSTDYDCSDWLFFEELSLERILDITEFHPPIGLMLSVGGQAPNKLARAIADAGLPVLGTSAEYIEKAENRMLFSKILEALKLPQADFMPVLSEEDVEKAMDLIPFPWIIRPSFVLGGKGMQLIHSEIEARQYWQYRSTAQGPLLCSAFLEEAQEFEFDAVADGATIYSYAISEHIEEAGLHSGDASLRYPAALRESLEHEMLSIATTLSKELRIKGVFNIQFLLKNNQLKIIELNMRASRSLPFVSKVGRIPMLQQAVAIGLGKKIPQWKNKALSYFAIKQAQFSFHRLANVLPAPGLQMQSTGEIACLGDTWEEAFLKSALAIHNQLLPIKTVFLYVDKDDPLSEEMMAQLMQWKVYDASKTNAADWKKSFEKQEVDLCICLHPSIIKQRELLRLAIDFRIPWITHKEWLKAFIYALYKKVELKTKKVQDYA